MEFASSIRKLNIGCGPRIAPGWTNIDLVSAHPNVISHNILRPLPFEDQSFDVVYASHVLEHLTKAQGESLVREARRVLRVGGLLRLVVPDLEATCREYLRITSDFDAKKYEWILIELLDQLVRTKSGGAMRDYYEMLANSANQQHRAYVQERTGEDFQAFKTPTSHDWFERFRHVNLRKLARKITFAYIGLLRRMVPGSLRATIGDYTTPGEKHRWMYDRWGLKLLCESAELSDIEFLTSSVSSIPGFNNDGLDVRPDGRPWKGTSIYCECRRPCDASVPG